MLRSLYAAVSGLRNHQTRMDVIGNNIANVNTTGFKASRVIFSDIYSQTLQPAAAGTATTGGVNPQQVGLGVAVASIDVLMTRAGSQYTGATLDMAIEGDGFFVVNDGTQEFYTRAGNFTLDSNDCITLNGLLVQGYMQVPTPSATLGAIDTTGYTNVSIDKDGNVKGLDATNNSVTIAKVGLATFSNQDGLEKSGDSLYIQSANSGAPVYGTPGTGAAGTLNPGSLEMSNVDLSKEFTDMITTQRGFQANSRVITTSDTLLEELVNLKR